MLHQQIGWSSSAVHRKMAWSCKQTHLNGCHPCETALTSDTVASKSKFTLHFKSVNEETTGANLRSTGDSAETVDLAAPEKSFSESCTSDTSPTHAQNDELEGATTVPLAGCQSKELQFVAK